MKKFIIIIYLAICGSLNAQIPITGGHYGDVPGAYYKDTNNELNKFTGLWQYTSGSTSITIRLVKRIHHWDAFQDIFYDFIAGEYIYMVNGSTIVNTMSNLQTEEDMYDNSFSGNLLLWPHFPPACTTCAADEKRLNLDYMSPDREFLMQHFIVRHVAEEFEPDQLHIFHWGQLVAAPIGGSPIDSPIIPEGNYIFHKIGN